MTQRNEPSPRNRDGGTTQDLGIRAVATPPAGAAMTADEQAWHASAAAEQQIQTRGRWMIFLGIAVGVFGIALGGLWHYALHEGMPMFLLVPLNAFSIGCIGVGVLEYLSRSTRAVHQANLQRMCEVERGLRQLVDLMPEALQDQFYKGTVFDWRSDTGTGGTAGTWPAQRAGGSAPIPFRRAAKQRNETR